MKSPKGAGFRAEVRHEVATNGCWVAVEVRGSPARPLMSFRAQDSSFELARALSDLHRQLGRKDHDLAQQIRRATNSIALNLAEGNGRVGKDRLHHFRIARGSVLEVEAGLHLAVAWGYVAVANVRRPLSLVDDLQAMLGGLLR